MAVSPLTSLTCKRCLPSHSPAPLHAMSINIASPRLRLSLSRNSLVSIGAVSPTNITSFGHNYSHSLSAEQLSQDPFTNDYAKYQQPDQATAPVRKVPQLCSESHLDLSPRVDIGSSHISRYAVQGGSVASGSSMGDSEDTCVFGYSGSHEAYDAVPPNEEEPDLTSVLTPDSRPTTSQSFNSDWIRDRFEMVTPESRSFPNTLRDQGGDAPEWEDLSSVNNEYFSSSEIDPTTAATSQSFPPDEDNLLEPNECTMSVEGSLPISGLNTVISTAEATSVEEPDVTVSVTFNPSDLAGQHPSFHSHISSVRRLSIRTDTRVENLARHPSDSSTFARDRQQSSTTFPRRLSRLVSRRVNAVLGSGRRAESHVGAAPAVPDLAAPTRRRRYTLSIEVEVDVPSDEYTHHRPPPPPPLSADSQAQTEAQAQAAPLLRSSSSSSVPTPAPAAAPPEPPSSTVHVERERNSLERLLHRVRRRPAAAVGVSIDSMSERDRERLKAQMRRYST